MIHNDFNQSVCENVSKSDPLCDECREKNKQCEFYLSIPNYYRTGIGGLYFFCSDDCLKKFKLKICQKCFYNKNLIYIETEGYMLCTDDYPYGESCFNRFKRGDNFEYSWTKRYFKRETV